MAALGLAQVAELELRYVELPELVEQVVTLPITVNVVPGDEAAGRVPDPVVRSEVLFQEAQDDKKAASEALERGDRETAAERPRRGSDQADRGRRGRARGGACRPAGRARRRRHVRGGDARRTTRRTCRR